MTRVVRTRSGTGTETSVKLLVVGRLQRHRQLRRLLLAHLVKQRMEGGAEDDDEGIEGEEDDDEGGERARAQKLVKLLVVGRMARQRQLRRLLLAHFLKQRMEGAEDDDEGIEGEEDDDEGGESGERARAQKLVKLLVVGRMQRLPASRCAPPAPCPLPQATHGGRRRGR